MIGATISHYKIIGKLGAGGMGEVYLAEDTQLHRTVALKFLPSSYATDPDVLARFKREAQAAAALDHPGIVTVHEVATHVGRPFIVMAHVEGQPLRELIQSSGLSLDSALDIALQVADALSKVHEANIVHRDLKPENIIIDKDGRARILDFGLAKLRGATQLTKESSTLGTIRYMSPEQTRGEEVDSRSDIFSLGSVLYEIITQQLPFEGDHPAAIMYAIATENPQPLLRFNREATPELERIVFKMLAKDPAERYQSAAELAVDLRRARTTSTPPQKRASSWLRVAFPLSLVAVAVLLFVIFTPFKITVDREAPAIASDNSLAIMYFENVADREDSARLGEIVTNLLITDLSESNVISVVSSQRLYDILKHRGKEGLKVIDRSTATQVATDASAKWMLMGSILQVTPVLIVTCQVVDVASGNVVASQRLRGDSGDTVFQLVDRMTVAIRGDLDLTGSSNEAQDHRIADVTTQSQEAYRHYIEGREYANKFMFDKARDSFDTAIQYDSTYAMAHLRLALFSREPERAYHVAKARQYAHKVGAMDRRYIESSYTLFIEDPAEGAKKLNELAPLYPDPKEIYFMLGMYYQLRRYEPSKAIEYFKRVMEINPQFKLTYNQLAYCYEWTGDFDKSIWAINKYIELAPNEPNPYDSRGDLYAGAGRIDEAIDSYQKALQIEPDFTSSRSKIGDMRVFKRDYVEAERIYRQGLENFSPSVRSSARYSLAAILLCQGRIEAALSMLGRGIAADELDGYVGDSFIIKYAATCQLHLVRKEYEQAIATAEAIARKGDQAPFCQTILAVTLARAGHLGRAQEVAQEIRQLETEQSHDRNFYWVAQGWIEFSMDNYASACESFERSMQGGPVLFPRQYLLALAYLKARRLSDAVHAYDDLLKRFTPSRLRAGIYSVLVYYYAGRAYEASGWNDRAIQAYEEFLQIWENADPGIEEIEDAQRRLAMLHG